MYQAYFLVDLGLLLSEAKAGSVIRPGTHKTGIPAKRVHIKKREKKEKRTHKYNYLES